MVGAVSAAAVMFTVLLLGYEVIVAALFGPDVFDSDATLNVLRFAAAAIGALSGAAAVLIPSSGRKRVGTDRNAAAR